MKSIKFKMNKVECQVCGYKVGTNTYKSLLPINKKLPSSHFPEHTCKQKEKK